MSAPRLIDLAPDAAVCIDGSCLLPPAPAARKKSAMPVHTLSAEDRFEIVDLVNRYSTGIDTRDWELFRSTFTEDASVDFGFARWDGSNAFTAFMRETHKPAGRTLHRMTNTVVTGLDPLEVRTYGDAVVLQSDNQAGTIANAWYDDELVRTAHGLQIKRRNVHMISMRAIGPNLAANM